jgi:6,7-dimethyl-8-ribityllumazine synthase
MSTHVPTVLALDARGFAIGIAAARYNAAYVDALLERCLATLRASGASDPAVVRVPGSNELPFAIQALADQHRFDALIALGVLIRGDTIHYVVIAQSTAQALQSVALATRTPVINGVLTVENEAQAADRCQGAADRGAEFAHAALDLADLARKLRPTA